MISSAKDGYPPRLIDTTQIEYMYRDGGNYKFYGLFQIAGIVSLADIRPHLLHGEYFRPSLIGLDSLVPEKRNDDDHSLHEFVSFEPKQAEDAFMNKRDFIRLIAKVNETGWFTYKSSNAEAY